MISYFVFGVWVSFVVCANYSTPEYLLEVGISDSPLNGHIRDVHIGVAN